MRISDWSSDLCSSDLFRRRREASASPSPRVAPVTALLQRLSAVRGRLSGSVAKIVKLEPAWRRLDGRNDDGFQVARSVARRVGKECVSKCWSRCSPFHLKKKLQ